MAYPVTLNGRTYTLADFEGNNYVDGLPDAFEDFVTHAGDVYNDTSTTSNSIGTGSKTFTVAAGKPYQAGTPLRIADAAAPATNFLDAVVTSYSGTTLVVEAIGYGGSGTKTSWTVNIGGAKTIDGTLGVSQGGTGATTAAAARTNLDTYSKTEADSRFLNVSGEASDVTMTGNVTIGDAAGDTLTVNATADFNTGINVDGTITSDGLTIDGDLTVDTDTLYVDSTNNRVGIGTPSPSRALTVYDASNSVVSIRSSNSGASQLTFGDDDDNVGSIVYSHSGLYMAFTTETAEAMRIDSSQRVLIGATSSQNVLLSNGNALQLQGLGSNTSAISTTRHSADSGGPYVNFGKSRGTADGAVTLVQENDVLGQIFWSGADGTDIQSPAAGIQGMLDGTAASNDMPGRITFRTTPDGTAATVERMRISNNGNVSIGYTSDLGRTLGVNGDAYITGGYLEFGGSESTPTTANPTIYRNNPGPGPNMVFANNATEAMRIDQGQRVLIGYTANISTSDHNAALQVVGQGTADYHGATASIIGFSNNSNGAYLNFASGRSNTAGTYTIVANDDTVGQINFAAADGTDMASRAAFINVNIDGAPSSNDTPGRIIFGTTADGAASPTERMRISEDGTVSIGSPASHPSILRLRDDLNGDTSANTGTGVLTIQGATSTYSSFIGMDATGLSIGLTSSARNLRFVTNSQTAMTIDTSQRVLIGLTSEIGTGHKLQLNNDMTIMTFDGATTGANGVRFIKSRASSPGSNAIVGNGDDVGFLDFRVDDGTDYGSRTAVITSSVDGTPGTNDTPGNLRFFTTADGSSSVTERMRIDSAGRVMIAGASGNVNPPTTLMGDMNAAFRVGTSSAQIGSLFKYTYGPNTNVDGAVFQLRAGSNGNAAYIRITVSNYQGVFEAHYYCRNASGNWTVGQATVTDVGGPTAPSLTVAGNGGTSPTITVDLNSTSYSGGFLDVTTSSNWQLTLA